MTKQKFDELLERKRDHTNIEVSILMGLSLSTVQYWLKKAREQGIVIPPHQNRGRKPLQLK